jgi:hypothetical protein
MVLPSSTSSFILRSARLSGMKLIYIRNAILVAIVVASVPSDYGLHDADGWVG